jgi:hypothetical protein
MVGQTTHKSPLDISVFQINKLNMSKSTASYQIHSEMEITLPLQVIIPHLMEISMEITTSDEYIFHKKINLLSVAPISCLPPQQRYSEIMIPMTKCSFYYGVTCLWRAKRSIWRRVSLWSFLILCNIFKCVLYNKWSFFYVIKFEKTIFFLVCSYIPYIQIDNYEWPFMSLAR